ncbi:MAG: LysR substrate-binding domain-containing protein, partial [Thiolinea sp.]
GHFTPRAEAEMLLEDAELSILATQQFVNRAKLIARGDTGLIRLGTIGCPANSLLPELIADYSLRFPRVNIDMQVRSSAQLLHLVNNGQLDIAIIEGEAASNKVMATSVTLPCVCIMAATDPLAGEAEITPELLRNRQLIGIQDGNPIDRQLRACFSRHGLDYHTQIKGFFFSVVRRMVALGGGVAVVDAINGSQSLEDGVIWRPFVPSIKYQLSVIHRRDEELHNPVRQFKQELLQRLQA